MGTQDGMGTREARRLVAALVAQARERGLVPEAGTTEAERATTRWLDAASVSGERVSRVRVEGYFWSVVRRQALSGLQGMEVYRRRCIAATLGEDMLAAGHDRSVVLSELSRAVGASHAAEWAASAA